MIFLVVIIGSKPLSVDNVGTCHFDGSILTAYSFAQHILLSLSIPITIDSKKNMLSELEYKLCVFTLSSSY